MSVRQVFKLLPSQKTFVVRRNLSGKAAPQTHPLLEKFRHFQQDDGVPVYLKDGLGDRLLFQATVLLIFIGLADGLSTLYSMAFKKKK